MNEKDNTIDPLEIEIEPHELGAVLAIQAQPGSRKNEVRGFQNGAVKVCVTQVAEKGKANKVVLEQLAEFLGVRKSQLELLAGETSRRKKVLVRGLSIETLRSIIAEKRI